MILQWEKPVRIMSTEEWAGITADGAPPGVYVSNMSDEDAQSWKAKLIGRRGGIKQVEIRKTTMNGTHMLLIVSLDGFRHTNGKEFPGANVCISLNGPAIFTFEDYTKMNVAIQEAKMVLKGVSND